MSDEKLRAAKLALSDPGVRAGQRWRHVKSAHVYRVVDLAVIEATLLPAVVYTDDPGANLSWVRPLTEWLERFERMPESDVDAPNGPPAG